MNREKAMLALTLSTLSLFAASVAWACTAQPMILGITPPAAVARQEVGLTGVGASPGSMVEIRWNSAAGPVIGGSLADEAGNYSLSAVVPDVPPGIYTVVFLSGAGTGRTAIEVLPSPTGSSSPSTRPREVLDSNLWSGFSESQSVEVPMAGTEGSQPGSALAGLFMFGIGASTTAATMAIAFKRRMRRSAGS